MTPQSCSIDECQFVGDYPELVEHIYANHRGYVPPAPPPSAIEQAEREAAWKNNPPDNGMGVDHADTPPDQMDIYDPTKTEGIEQLPAVTTSMTADQFKQWVASDGEIFVVYLPQRRSFVMKVPAVHNSFFVAMMQQVKLALGHEVQAVRMNLVTGGPPEIEQPRDDVGYAEFTTRKVAERQGFGMQAGQLPTNPQQLSEFVAHEIDPHFRRSQPTLTRHGTQCTTPECVLDAGHRDHHESQHGASWRTYDSVTEKPPTEITIVDGEPDDPHDVANTAMRQGGVWEVMCTCGSVFEADPLPTTATGSTAYTRATNAHMRHRAQHTTHQSIRELTIARHQLEISAATAAGRHDGVCSCGYWELRGFHPDYLEERHAAHVELSPRAEG